MMMLECDAKRLLASAGVNVPQGTIWRKGVSAQNVQVSSYPAAVKAQVRSGARGKHGGVQRVNEPAALAATAAKLFATEFSGEKPEALLIEPWLAIERETYLSVAVDGRAEGYVVLYAPRGGIDIEESAPPVRYAVGAPWNFRVHGLREVLEAVEPDYQWREKVIALAQRLIRTAAAHDCTTVEINPLVKLADGAMIAADAKIALDEWAAFRNNRISDECEAQKQRADPYLRACLDMQHMYVHLDGDIGVISGGAGMTMAAMDMIAEYGGRPACFLDCSPGPTSTRGYRPAFAMLDADPAVKVILVSVFGGGTQMQRVASSMQEVMAERTSGKPVVYRLDGTHVDQVAGIFAQFGAHNHACLEDAVAEAVRLAGVPA